MKGIGLTLLGLILALPLQAGENAGGLGYWLTGYGSARFTALQDSLRAAGYPTASPAGWLNGGEGYVLINNVLIGGGGFGVSLGKSAAGTYVGRSSFGAGYFSLGYALSVQESWLVFASVGLGGGGWTQRIHEPRTGSYGELLQQPGQYLEVHVGGVFTRAAVTALWNTRWLLVGLQAGVGYLWALHQEINENIPGNGPALRDPIWWAGFTLGGGGWRITGEPGRSGGAGT